MKPEFSKPFDLAAAKAGAPFCGANGEAVRVLIWDRKHPTHPILAIEEDGEQEAVAFRADGTTTHRESLGVVSQLVMLPLGMIDGKPVFTGDVLDFEGRRCVALATGRSFPCCAWPAPAKVYPEFTGDLDKLRQQYNASIGEEMGRCLLRVANAALRHAIDSGQVVACDHEVVVMGRATRTAHDMAVARAAFDAGARLAGTSGLDPDSRPAYFKEWGGLNLPIIIAAIK